MGIHGLLPAVKAACRDATVSELAGCSVAVDVSCLLHKGIFGCMDQIATGVDTNFYIFFVRKHVQTLLDLGCHVIMVFDGRPLPAKQETNDCRRIRRAENISAGHVLLSQGREKEASDMFRKATHITAEVVEKTIQFFRTMPCVDIIVAPYEADAQLAFLSNEGLADAVITQDSDLIAFGCTKIFFKWDHKTGEGVLYDKTKLADCFPKQFGFTFEKFRRMCILAGCDYLQAGLPGVGLNKAKLFFTKTSQTNLHTLLKKVPSYLKMPSLVVSNEFVEDFILAENTFLYQIVFDPRSNSQRPLTPYPDEGNLDKENVDVLVVGDAKKRLPIDDRFAYAGKIVCNRDALRLALGNRIEQRSSMEDVFFVNDQVEDWSIWHSNYTTKGRKRQERKEREQKEKTNLGAFKLDSPTRRQKSKPASLSQPSSNSPQLGSDSKTAAKRCASLSAYFSSASKPPTLKTVRPTQSQRPRNGAGYSNMDEMLRMYSSQPTEMCGAQEVEPVVVASKESERKRSSCLALLNEQVTSNSPRSTTTSSQPLSSPVPQLSAKRSAHFYFMNGSPASNNPFKKPKFSSLMETAAVVAETSQSATVPLRNLSVSKEHGRDQTSKLGVEVVADDEPAAEVTVTKTRTTFAKYGFRAAGLSRSAMPK